MHEHHHHDHEHNDNITPKEEMIALMRYMVGHNESHTKELADLAVKLLEAGNKEAYDETMLAVHDFESGNEKLKKILEKM